MATNIHELVHRAERVRKMVAVLDANLVVAGVHPFSAAAVFHVERLSEQCWSKLVAAADLKPSKGPLNPSAETRAAIVAVYSARPEHVAQAVEHAKAVR